jgi:hypothetical protein
MLFAFDAPDHSFPAEMLTLPSVRDARDRQQPRFLTQARGLVGSRSDSCLIYNRRSRLLVCPLKVKL